MAGKKVTIYMDDEVIAAVGKLAARERRSVSQVITIICENALKDPNIMVIPTTE
jgi:hypothetical protein